MVMHHIGRNGERVFSPKRLAEQLKVSRQTIDTWRKKGIGPAYYEQDGRYSYYEKDVIEWLESRKKLGSAPPPA